MGLATTAIFWGFELGFDYLFASRNMRYVVALIGLAIGYVAKYHLDKRYVFRILDYVAHCQPSECARLYRSPG